MKYLKGLTIGFTALLMFTSSSMSQKSVAVEPQPKKAKSSVSTDELETFAGIYKVVQEKNKEAQQRMAKTVQDKGITIQRYQKLAKAKNNPNAEVKATAEEKKKLKAINKAFTGIQNEFKTKITDIIKEGGMTPKRYQEVYQSIRKDKSLQEEFGKIMQG